MSLIRLLSHRLPLPLSRLPRSFPSISRTHTCSCIRTFATTSKSTSTSSSKDGDDSKTPSTSTSKDDDNDNDDDNDIDMDEDDLKDLQSKFDDMKRDAAAKVDKLKDLKDFDDDDDIDIRQVSDVNDDNRDVVSFDLNKDEIIITPSKIDKSSTKTDKSSSKKMEDDDDDEDDDFEREYDQLERSANKITEKYILPMDIRKTIRPSRPGYVFIRTMIAEELQDVEIKETDLKDEKSLERALDLKELEILEKEFPDNEKDYAEELRIEAEKTEITMDEEMPMLRMEQARLNALIAEQEIQDSPNEAAIADLTHRLEFIQSRILLWEGGYFEDPTEEEIKEVKDEMRAEAEDKIAAAREAQAAAIQKYSQNMKPEVIKKLAAEHPEAYPLAAALANNEIIEWYTDKEEKHMIRHRPRTKKSATYEPVKEDLPAITAFLTSIKQEKHIDKFPSWWALMTMKSLRMKKANIGCQDRKKILKAVENHKRSRYREYLTQHIQTTITTQKSEYDIYAQARKQEYDAQRQQTKSIRQQQTEAWIKQQPLRERVQQEMDAQRAIQIQKEIEAQIAKLETTTTTTIPIVPKTQSRDRSYEKTW